jgi:hypothetical protein
VLSHESGCATRRHLTRFAEIKDSDAVWLSQPTSNQGQSREKTLSYIESNLLPEEQLVYRAKLHWKIFWKSFLLIVIGIGLVALQPIVGGIGIALGFLVGLRMFVEYKTSEFGVTNKRVIIKVGFFRRRTLELLLRQVEAISVEQTVLGRTLGFGSVTLTGTGGVREVFHNISSPLEFRRRIHGQEA